jgi:hypothetical protein
MRAIVAGLALAACGDNAEPLFAFERRVIDPLFRAEGVTVFDVNRDGGLDVVTEELWYAGPDFAPHEIRTPRDWDPRTAYAHCFHAFHRDIDGDGYDDLVVFGPPGNDVVACINPQGADQHWDCETQPLTTIGESPAISDQLGTGARSILLGVDPERALIRLTPLDADTWVLRPISESGFMPALEHGLGTVDVDGDGRVDVVTGSGWLQQPADGTVPWPWHPVAICPNDCAHITGHDIDGDGRMDLLGTSPHGYGAWWWQQVGAPTEPTFVRHLIDDTNSQNHAARLADLDGDGVPELITGKRWLAHLSGDPGTDDPVLLVVYRYTRDATGAITWQRTVIDDDSGVGNQFEVVDVDRDGKPDIVVATKKGLFLFQQK